MKDTVKKSKVEPQRVDIWEFLEKVDRPCYDFPHFEDVKVAVICSGYKESSSYSEFCNGLNNDIITRFKAAVTDKNNVLKKVKEVIDDGSYNVLAIVRGGFENSEEKAMFNDLGFCVEVSKFKGYKVIGIGHDKDSFLLDLAVNHAAATPSLAGTHIRDMLKLKHDFKKKIIHKLEVGHSTIYGSIESL